VISLNITGLVPDQDENEAKKSKHISSRHTTIRKSIALNFTNMNKPLATSLAYWQSNKLATPLFWYLFDSLSKYNDPNNPDEKKSAFDVIQTVSPAEFAEELLKKVRNKV
jgi:hypothetical protein